MRLYDLLTPEELASIRKHDLIRNSEVKDLTVEEIKALSATLNVSDLGEIVFEASHAFDELLFRERLKQKPATYESLPDPSSTPGQPA